MKIVNTLSEYRDISEQRQMHKPVSIWKTSNPEGENILDVKGLFDSMIKNNSQWGLKFLSSSKLKLLCTTVASSWWQVAGKNASYLTDNLLDALCWLEQTIFESYEKAVAYSRCSEIRTETWSSALHTLPKITGFIFCCVAFLTRVDPWTYTKLKFAKPPLINWNQF